MKTELELTDERLLDNPIWHSLVGHHASFAVGGAAARRYQTGIAQFAGFPDEAEPNWAELGKLMTVDEIVLARNVPLPQGSGFVSEFASDSAIQQYVYRATSINSETNHGICELQEADVPDMLRLVETTHPGPFLPRTIRMGGYVGIRVEGRLVAMAGERLHPGRFCEISAVCTDPAYVRRGYATPLVTHQIARILARGEIPFLHVAAGNAKAIRLYKQLGFDCRANFPIQDVRFVGVDGPPTAIG
jgi:ribosomal protein S18 acetylase RimI-like enzyme